MSVCCYVNCPDHGITNLQSHVEIKTVLPSSGVKKVKSNSKMLISWKSNGEAILHRHCYDLLLKSSRARNSKSLVSKMLQEEKALFKEAVKTAEHFDSLEAVKNEGMKVAGMIIEAKHCVVFTGAGISTSAGIGDYRGKSGKWTQQDQASINMDSIFASGSRETTEETIQESMEDDDDDDDGGVPYESLRPTYTHEALQKLIEDGYVKHLISQNGDGLHGLSGVSAEHLSELHGNVFVEICEKCKTRYDRPFYVMDDSCSLYFEQLEDNGKASFKKPSHAKKCGRCGLSHRTGRRCEKKGCKGFLMDSIINFGDMLEDEILDRATLNAQNSDMMICLGSTMTVTPANSLVEMTKEPQRIVICNRQTTDIDAICMKSSSRDGDVGSRVFGDCDIFMKEVMQNILSSENLKSWEGDREKRMESYNSKRVQPH